MGSSRTCCTDDVRRFLLAAVFLCVASVAVAQVQTGTIRGKVTDEVGGVLPGVTAEARLLPSGVIISAVTDGSGDYAFEAPRAWPLRPDVHVDQFRHRQPS